MHYYDDDVKEDVLPVQGGISGSFLLSVKKQGYEYGQVGKIGYKKVKLEEVEKEEETYLMLDNHKVYICQPSPSRCKKCH